MNCPKCNSEMKLRKGKYGQFWGCSKYPKCKHTMKYAEPIEQVQEVNLDELEALLEDIHKPKVVKKVKFKPSKYQLAIFDFVENGTGNAVIEAVAGSGKTTSLVQALQYTPSDLNVGFVAFNKSIAIELENRAPEHVHISTLHSLGLSNIRMVRKVKIDEKKVYWIIKNEYEKDAAAMKFAWGIVKVVSLCKANLIEPSLLTLNFIMDNYNISIEDKDMELVLEMSCFAFKKSIEQQHKVDFDDMIYFSAIGKVECKKFDILFVDECQDLNASQVQMVLNSIHSKSRVIAIGDRNQSIYQFRGADSQAIPKLIRALDAITLPLSITYRCDRLITEEAQKLVHHIQCRENADDGVVEHIGFDEFASVVNPGDMVLCRTNAPLIGPAFRLIREGVKAVVLGRDIGKGLIRFINKIQKKHNVENTNLTALIYLINEYKIEETVRLIKQDKEQRVQRLEDKVDTIEALTEGVQTIEELKNKVRVLFSDKKDGVVFSSVHKAKGGEANRVFILHPELMPHPMAYRSANPEALQQEFNIKYVAITRAKHELYFVGAKIKE